MEPQRLQCPECSVEMAHDGSLAFSIDRCRSCRGVWFDREDIVAYLANGGQSPSLPDVRDFLGWTEIPAGRCPRCHDQSLRLGQFAGLSFERCAGCHGFFLSDEQIAQIVLDARSGSRDAEGPQRSAGELVFDFLGGLLYLTP